ncbi:MAG: hypothetical protein IPJ18_19950 [Betaproteobacteria bacterium]|nr:hypothetical protein [Betaproteobacteria bacterium]
MRTPFDASGRAGPGRGKIAISPAAQTRHLAQRLTRQGCIRDSGLRFELPQAEEFDDRCHAVLDAIYGAYTLGWHHTRTGIRPARRQSWRQGALPGRAVRQAATRRIASLRAPRAPGLLALLRFLRKPAARLAWSPTGEFIPRTSKTRRREVRTDHTGRCCPGASFFTWPRRQQRVGAFCEAPSVGSCHSVRPLRALAQPEGAVGYITAC